MKIIKNCQLCKKEFLFRPSPSRLTTGRGKYCSRSCKDTIQKGKHFSPQTEIKKGQILGSLTMFKKGQKAWNKGKPNTWMVGKKNHIWKGGIHKHIMGYLQVSLGSGRPKLQHRLMLEEFLGRKLESWEIVHHINQDKTDNRLENLRIMNRRTHARLHIMEGK